MSMKIWILEIFEKQFENLVMLSAFDTPRAKS